MIPQRGGRFVETELSIRIIFSAALREAEALGRVSNAVWSFVLTGQLAWITPGMDPETQWRWLLKVWGGRRSLSREEATMVTLDNGASSDIPSSHPDAPLVERILPGHLCEVCLDATAERLTPAPGVETWASAWSA